MALPNKGCELDLDWINKVEVNLRAVEKQVEHLARVRQLKGDWQAAWLLRAVTCIDLTTLAGDDTKSNAQRLCFQASKPIHQDILKQLKFTKEITTGAVCVYPSRVADCVQALKKTNASQINVASVAAGFPSGQYPLSTRLEEIRQAVRDGATEIDIVINRNLALNGDWRGVYDELIQMKLSCGHAHMKSILAVGELATLTNVYKASLVAMMAGSDFIKTSTGKENVNATLPVGLVMARAIRDYYWRTGFKVGLKPAGSIRTPQDVLRWQILMKEELGGDWTKPNLFRIGASALLTAIEQQLFVLAFKRSPIPGELSMN